MTEEQKPIPEEKQSFRLLRSVWQWTGLGDKKLWDYLQLLIVPIFLAAGAFYLEEQANQRQQRIADDRARQETLNKYFDAMTDLLFEQKLRAAKPESEARTVARARTLTTLRELDSGRKGQLLRFLQEAKLIGGDEPVIDLSDADLSDADLSDADLSGADLSGAILLNADLSNADLSNAILVNAELRFADLSGANLNDADLLNANLSDADLSGANLNDADLSYIDLRGADLKDALFCKTKMPHGKENNQDCPQQQSP